MGGWTFGGRAGVEFGDRGCYAYFYDVTGGEARPVREAYRTSGGYGGLSVSAYASKILGPRLSWGLYVRWDNLDGAVYADSPLVRTRNNFVAGTALTWTFAESARRVPARRGW